MIDISRYLNSDTIATNLNASTKEEAIKLLLDKIYQVKDLFVSQKEAYNAVIGRERKMVSHLFIDQAHKTVTQF
ncbi:MAG: PTS sugar transporter subunit IIA [Candidatus Tantalella remota]|nr:PTS sugar transporter subunit IIA [Candidatus Tantalella remota]